MIVNPDILRRSTIALLQQIDRQIEEVTRAARTMGTTPEKMRDANGNWVMIPLILAKTQAYATLVQLQDMR